MFLGFRNILTVIVIVICLVCHGQDTPLGSRSASMGRTSVALVDEWANNPAGLSSIKSLKIAVFYESHFLLKELGTKALTAVYPDKLGSFAMLYKHTGYNLFNKQILGLAYSKSFADKLSIGVRMDYILCNTGNKMGNASAITFDIGFHMKLSQKVLLAGWSFNPVSVKLGNERLFTSYKIGVRWLLSNDLIINAEVEKNTYVRPIIFRIGIEYCISTKFIVRTGISTNREVFSFGMGVKIGKLNLKIGSAMHINLGFTPNTELGYTY